MEDLNVEVDRLWWRDRERSMLWLLRVCQLSVKKSGFLNQIRTCQGMLLHSLAASACHLILLLFSCSFSSCTHLHGLGRCHTPSFSVFSSFGEVPFVYIPTLPFLFPLFSLILLYYVFFIHSSSSWISLPYLLFDPSLCFSTFLFLFLWFLSFVFLTNLLLFLVCISYFILLPWFFSPLFVSFFTQNFYSPSFFAFTFPVIHFLLFNSQIIFFPLFISSALVLGFIFWSTFHFPSLFLFSHYLCFLFLIYLCLICIFLSDLLLYHLSLLFLQQMSLYSAFCW